MFFWIIDGIQGSQSRNEGGKKDLSSILLRYYQLMSERGEKTEVVFESCCEREDEGIVKVHEEKKKKKEKAKAKAKEKKVCFRVSRETNI